MGKNLDYYLKLPYRIEIITIPDDEGGGFMARMPQFGELGIVGDGDTEAEALNSLETYKKQHFADCLEKGKIIPEP